jgi:hypothetical protein
VLIFNSEDRYIRRLLLQQNWVINPDLRSKYYHLKWIFKPLLEDYNVLSDGQYINHIKNSHELTSKNYLDKNLRHYRDQWLEVYKHYPKCYDMSKKAQR